MKGAEFHRNNFSRNHVGGGGECCLVRGVSSCYLLKYAPYTLCDDAVQCNGTVIAGTVFVSLFENWGNVSFLPVIRNLASLE